jgi:hypothetical protein
MVRAKPKPKEILSTSELDNLKSEREELERSLREGEGYGAGTQGAQVDEAAIKRQINRISAAIIDGTPGKLTGKQKDSLEREARQLEERFQEGMPTRYEMSHPSKCPGAVRKHMKWLQRNETTGAVDRYRQIQRVLNPGEEKSIETLRKDK